MISAEVFFMELALKQAKKAAAAGEIPVGALIVSPQNEILAQTHNLCEQANDATAHAEILAIGAASLHLGSKILNTCTLYVSLEPCPMCAAALYWAQIGRVVYAAADEKRGYTCFSPNLLHPRTKVERSDLADDAAQLMRDFFQKRRK